MTHGRHIYPTASDIAMAKLCAYPFYQYELPHWKCVLRCCETFQMLLSEVSH